MDEAHVITDKMLAELEKRIAREYKKAHRDLVRKVNDYFAQFAADADAKLEALREGQISLEEYQEFIGRKMGVGQRWVDMRDRIAQDYHNANLHAREMYRETQKEVYALNRNYAVYDIEKKLSASISFTLYDRATVDRLLRDNPKLLPDPGKKMAEAIKKNPDLKWNKQKVQSAILQSILQGESVGEAAKRLMQVTQANYKQAVRYARTAITGAQNAGRLATYEEAVEEGAEIEKVWEATLDDRTRHAHRELDGQTVPVNEPFEADGYTIMFPGDPDAAPEMVWNCRCSMSSGDVKYPREKITYSPKLGSMTYEEWKEGGSGKRVQN